MNHDVFGLVSEFLFDSRKDLLHLRRVCKNAQEGVSDLFTFQELQDLLFQHQPKADDESADLVSVTWQRFLACLVRPQVLQSVDSVPTSTAAIRAALCRWASDRGFAYRHAKVLSRGQPLTQDAWGEDVGPPTHVELNLDRYQNLRSVSIMAFPGIPLPKACSVGLPAALQSVSAASFSFVRLSCLNLSGCVSLTELPTSFAASAHISTVVMPPHLETIGERAFAYLICDSIVFPPTVRCVLNGVLGFSNIKRLDLVRCDALQEWPDAFCQFASIESLLLPPQLAEVVDPLDFQ